MASYRKNLYLGQSKTALLVLLFILLSVFRLVYFSTIDPFFIASFVFCLYFIMFSYFVRVSEHLWFKCFETLLILMLLYNAIDYIDANTTLINIFNYDIPAFMEGVMNPIGDPSQAIFSSSQTFGIIVRSIGVSGTNYASSALTAATAIYFLVLKRRVLFYSSLILLLFWGVGSSIVVAIAYILYLKRTSKISMIITIAGIYAVYLIIVNRGFNAEVYLYVINNLDLYDFVAASVLGEGKSVSSIQTEWRIIGLLFSLGMIGVFLIGSMILNYMAYAKYALYQKNDLHFKAGFGFIIVLLLSSVHYNTFFVFPNIFFFVMLITFSSIGYSRLKKQNSSIVMP